MADSSPPPFFFHFWDPVAPRASIISSPVSLWETPLSLLETGVEAHLPQSPLSDLDSHDAAVPLATVQTCVRLSMHQTLPRGDVPRSAWGEGGSGPFGCQARFAHETLTVRKLIF